MTAPADRPAVPAVFVPLLRRQVYATTLYLLLMFPFATAGFVYVVTVFAVGAGTSVTLLGLPVIAVGLLGSRRLGAVARRMARWGLGTEIPAPAPLIRGAGFGGWLWGTFLDQVSWRAALYLVLSFPLATTSFALTVALCMGAVMFSPLLVVTPWVIQWLGALHAGLSRGLLGPVPLSERVRRLQENRRAVVDTAAADLRRIERDLHDGAQARLVSLAMDLGMAKEKLSTGEDPEQAATLVASAHDEVKQALVELRDLARGIHPAVLTDRGLEAALSSVAARCAVPVRLAVDVPERPSPAVEAIAYFCVSELLVNISKHSQAASAAVTARRVDDRLYLDVYDDGVGGATRRPGSGLAGLVERVEAVDGIFALDSPQGGPTMVNVELPCVS